MENAIAASFLKSGDPVAESERVTFFFKVLVINCTAILKSLKRRLKDDSGVYTCVTYKAAIVVTREFVLKAGKLVYKFSPFTITSYTHSITT